MNSGCFSALGPPLSCIRLEVTLNAVELIALDFSNPFATVLHGELLVKMKISTGIMRDYGVPQWLVPGLVFINDLGTLKWMH